MAKIKSADDAKHSDPKEPLKRTGERSSPGSGEDEDDHEAADLQPNEVENDDTAR